MPDINELQFVRMVVPDLFEYIPRYLIERVEDRSWSVDRLYKFGPMFVSSPLNHFWLLKETGNAIKGVLFTVIDVLSEKLNVIIFSVDEEYQAVGNLEIVLDFLRQFIKNFNKTKDVEIKLKEKINWVTAQPGTFDEVGGQQPKTILVEV